MSDDRGAGHGHRRSGSIASAMLLLLAALAAGSCDVLSPDQARLSISNQLQPPVAAALVEVAATDGRRTWRYTAEDLAMPTSEVATATDGTLTVSVLVRDPAGPLPAPAIVAIPLKPDWQLSVSVLADTTDPIHLCFGCQGSRAFPLPASLQRAADDSLYVVWGGNSISDPVIY